jgi:Ulp1 family protease
VAKPTEVAVATKVKAGAKAKAKATAKVTSNGDDTDDDAVSTWKIDSIDPASLGTLQADGWLNDEVIHGFFQLLFTADAKLCAVDSSRKKSLFFKSFFISKLLNEFDTNPTVEGEYDYKQVRKWKKSKYLFDADKLIIPINKGGNHWVCAVVSMLDKTIDVLDSLGNSGIHYQMTLLRYLQDEHMDQKGGPLPDLESWRLIPPRETTPQQQNLNDCGVFVCQFAAAVLFDWEELSCNPVRVWSSFRGVLSCRILIASAIRSG